jgi:hypothetical protein
MAEERSVVIEAPLGRGGEMKRYQVIVNAETGQPIEDPKRRLTDEGLRAWAWHQEHGGQSG